MEYIKSKDISVIVQGPIDINNTKKCLLSIRRNLPDATIILSTWEGSNVDGLEYDEVLLNEDPKGFLDKNNPLLLNNLLRQLVSTQNALKKVETEYVLKIRSDIFLKSDKLLKLKDKFNECDEKFKIYDEKVIISSFFTKRFLCDKKGTQFMPVPFHISDWFYFGKTADVKKLLMVKLPDEPMQSEYLYHNPYKTDKLDLLHCSHQYAPEQYIAYLSYFNESKNPVKFKHYMDYNRENIISSEQFILNNFKVFSPQELDFICLKKNTNSDTYNKWTINRFSLPYVLWNALYRPYVYRALYKKYCDEKYTIPLNIKINEFIEKCIIARGRKCVVL